MKKIVFIALLLCILLLSFSAIAVEGEKGQTVAVTITLTGNPNNAVATKCSLVYDTSALKYLGNSQTATISFSNMQSEPIQEGATETVKFLILDGAVAGKSYPISVTPKSAFNSARDSVDDVTYSGATITVKGCSHDKVTEKVTKKATCTEAGEKSFVCDDCGETVKTETIPIDADAHDWGDWTETKAPTCMEKGEKKRVCKLNSEHTETGEVPINPDAHDWGEWTETKAPTCAAKGEKKRVCKLDGTHKETRNTDINPGAHDWGEWKITKDSINGAPGELTRICKNDSTHTETKEFICEHASSAWKETKAPGCTEAGEESRICDNCGAVLETKPIQALDHDWGDWAKSKEGTCTEPGEETRVCKRDAAHTETRETELDPENHDWGEWAKSKAATCTTPGEEKRTCKRDETHAETRETEKDPKNHDWGEWKETKAATCTEKGEETRVCKRDETHKETRETEINPDAHDWGEWTDSAAHPGHKERQCKNNSDHVEYNPPLQTIEWRYNQSVSSLGIRFRDIAPKLTDKWYMFTPISLSADGVQQIDLIAANVSKVGSVTVKVANGAVTVSYKVAYPAIEKDMAFTILPDLASVTDVEIKNLKTYAFGQEISIADELNGDTNVLLFVCGHVDYDFKDARNELFSSNGVGYQKLVNQLREIMD